MPKKSKRTVGLDIGSYNLKVVEIERTPDACCVTQAGIKDIRETKNLSDAIKQLLEETRIKTKEVHIALAGENVVARHLSLPKMNEEELRKAVMFKLEDHIPFKPDEVYVDFYIIGEELTSANKIRVFLVATKKTVLDNRLEIIRKAGLNPKLVTMDTLASMHTLYANYPDKLQSNIMVLNVGDKISNLLIAREKIPYFVRDTRFGGEAVTLLLQSKLQLDKKAAETLKHSLQTAPEETSRIIKTTMATLLNEIFVSVDFFENLTEQKIEEVFLSGGASQLFGLKDFLSGYLGLTVNELDPFKNISLAKHLSAETIKKISPYLTIALGMALEQP